MGRMLKSLFSFKPLWRIRDSRLYSFGETRTLAGLDNSTMVGTGGEGNIGKCFGATENLGAVSGPPGKDGPGIVFDNNQATISQIRQILVPF